MAKSSNQQLLKDEKKVLEVLQTEAKESIDVIAKKCKFSRQKVWRIMKKLERDNVIWGYSAIADDEFSGMKHFTMLMKRTTKPVDEKMMNEIINTRLDDLLPAGQIRIETIEYVHGCTDGIFSFQADSIVTAKRFVERFNQRFKGYASELQLLETIICIRKQGIKNPRLKDQIKYL
jgi:DNA-binding Lrp family transcriptional regulator